MKQKPVLWLLVAPLCHPDVSFAAATFSWSAEQMGAKAECYLECERQGYLFAQTGSTVLGGHHYQQFNYLHVLYEVKLILFGGSCIFASSASLFEDEILAETDSLPDLYSCLYTLGVHPSGNLFAPKYIENDGQKLDISPYYHAEIAFSKVFAYGEEYLTERESLPGETLPDYSLWCKDAEGTIEIAKLPSKADYGTLSIWLAERWKENAKAAAFGDPDAIRSRIPSLCREKRISVYAPQESIYGKEIQLSAYIEEKSAIADKTAELANKIGNPVLVGRQTCDGDLFAWGRKGVAMQIMDPNRPAFPVVSTISHHWDSPQGTIWDDEPDDAALGKWADEGKILSSLIFHSGEMAHNEAMLQLFDLCSFTGLKLGIAVHLARYQTCPQQWELLQIPVNRGGLKGRIEPVLHSGGLGVMAEYDCPPEIFGNHCANALDGIEKIAGKENLPRGHYFFCDTDLKTLQPVREELYDELKKTEMRYGISSARPGRNRLLPGSIPVLNQTARTQCTASPFIRITTEEDVMESAFYQKPGWFIGVLDAPVISFVPYIWRKGSRFMRLIDLIMNEKMINVLPDTVARYAEILAKKGIIPCEMRNLAENKSIKMERGK